jgi:glucokinase
VELGPEMKHVIAIDLGATKVLAGIVDQNLNVIHSITKPSRSSIAGLADIKLAVTKSCIIELSQFAEMNNITLVAGGIGFPEYVDSTGKLTSKDCVDWELQPKTDLAALTKLPWAVESDVSCAAIGELTLGSAIGFVNFLYITVSSGISHSFVINGKPWTGETGRAIGFGVTKVDYHGEFVTLESICSGLGIAREYEKKTGIAVESAAEVFSKIDTDQTAAEVVATASKLLGHGIANMVEILDPKNVIIGGGLWLGAATYRDQVLRELNPEIGSRIKSAKLTQAGLLGAAHAALQLTT